MSDPWTFGAEDGDARSADQVPAALIRLRRELQLLQSPPADAVTESDFEALAARLVALRQDAPIDRRAVWDRIEAGLDAQEGGTV